MEAGQVLCEEKKRRQPGKIPEDYVPWLRLVEAFWMPPSIDLRDSLPLQSTERNPNDHGNQSPQITGMDLFEPRLWYVPCGDTPCGLMGPLIAHSMLVCHRLRD